MRRAAVLLAFSTVLIEAQTIGSCPVLPADNIWNTKVDTLPLDPNSAAYVSTIGAGTGLKADFGAGLWDGGPIGIPYVTVPGTQTKYSATFLYADESDAGPYAVPLNAPIEGGSASTGDRHAISVDRDNCILYELYRAFPQSSSWQGDSGAIFNLLSNALRPSGWTSTDAAGLPIFPGLVRYDEVASGVVNHAIRFTVPQTRRAFIWPARHYASSLTGSQYPPMGQRFRLKATFDISTYPPEVQVILQALKTYGMMLADNGSAWYLSGAPDDRWNNDNLQRLRGVLGSNLEAVDVSSLMINVDSGQARQTAITVTVSPASASLAISATRQFTATVTNTPNAAVTWSVNGMLGGNSTVGWIDSTGFYTAPAAGGTFTVTATSVADATASGNASVTVTAPQPVSVTVSPTSASVRVGRTKQFTATVQNSSNQSVTWKVSGITGGNSSVGTISTSGLYKAPATVPAGTVTVGAWAQADATKFATASVKVTKH
jgi:hypothetical protein